MGLKDDNFGMDEFLGQQNMIKWLNVSSLKHALEGVQWDSYLPLPDIPHSLVSVQI